MAFDCSGKAFIKVYKKFLEWEWYSDINTKTLFLHCLLKANWKSGSWHGIDYEAGQFITSLPSLADETGLSIQQVRTALSKLKSTGEVTDYQQGKCRIITVTNWDCYQGDNRKPNRMLTDYQQDDNRIVTADKEYKEREEVKELKKNNSIGRFTPPTLDEIESYVYENNINIDSNAFFDHFTSNGWMVGGRSKMKDWKAAVRNWERNERKWGKQNSKPNGQRNLLEELMNA